MFPALGVDVTQQHHAIIKLIFMKIKACLITEPLLRPLGGGSSTEKIIVPITKQDKEIVVQV